MRRPASTRRRGSAYLLVLGVSMLVIIILLSSLLVGRLRLRVAALNESTNQADLAVMSTIELALLRIANDPSWRTTYTNDVWTADEAVGDITYSFKLVDEKDGDLAAGTTDPVRLLGKATVGDVSRIFSVLVVPDSRGVFATRVGSSADDAQQRTSDSQMFLDEFNLALAVDPGILADRTGLRFADVVVPNDAAIQSAYVQFEAAEAGIGLISLTVAGEAVDDAAPFDMLLNDINSRSLTGAVVAWSPPVWSNPGDAGAEQRIADVSGIIQEIVDRPGWSSGNAIVLVISGTGTRMAASYDGDRPDGAALLLVQWDPSGSMVADAGSWKREVTP